ncbi:MAG: Mur ligase family protein, partial [Pseudomonadota bacterium]|nr:Mur ligase family protein [Pseudomonadota bacterium]
MTPLTLAGVARLLAVDHAGPDAAVTGVGTDTRTLNPGELFVALSGPRFDGHDYLQQARERGAVGALVSRRVSVDLPQIVVPDTRLALGRLAAAWRRGYSGPLLALTGSNGKTTVKEMLKAVLSVRGPVLATKGNLNNDIGVPLTLLNINAQHAYAVIEMGANHGGEIAYLTALARPDVALITNAGPAHLEGFGDLDGVARGKGEIFQGLGPAGTAVINADDRYAGYWRSLAGGRRIADFGL